MYSNKMKISKRMYDSIKTDIQTVIEKTGFDLKTADKGKSGIKPMYLLLSTVSMNRAYDDTHPAFASGRAKRVLPFDGRSFTFYYDDNCDDTHLKTALKAIQSDLLS